MDELKPCPFCGGKAKVKERFGRVWDGIQVKRDYTGEWRAGCLTRGCIASSINNYYPSMLDAVEAWNRRAKHDN